MKSQLRLWKGAVCLAVLLGLVGPDPALARTLEVDQNDSGCDDVAGDPFCTIQAAINAAAPKDKVEVDDGIYAETVVIDKPGLRLVDDSDPVIDGGGANTIVRVLADGVQIEDFEIRNGAKGILLEGVRGAVVEECDVHDVTVGIELVDADENRIEENEIRPRETGILVNANSEGNRLDENEVKGGGSDPTKPGILVDGARSVLMENEVEDSGGVGFQINSDENFLERNSAEDTAKNGFTITGRTNTLVRNDAEGGTDVAHGFEVFGEDHILIRNESEDNAGRGFDIFANRTELIRNEAEGNGSSGFVVDGDSNRLIRNKAEKNDADGFDVDDGQANVLERNQSKRNAGFGIKVNNAAAATTFVRNRCKQNGLGNSDPVGLC